MDGTRQLARLCVMKFNNDMWIRKGVTAMEGIHNRLVMLIHLSLGEEITHAIQGTELYKEVKEHITEILGW